MADPHPIRNGLIVGVILMLIGGVASLVGPFAQPLAEGLWQPLASFAISAPSATRDAVTYRVPALWFLALLLVGCAVFEVPALRWTKRNANQSEPTWRDYTVDTFFTFRFRWRYGLGDAITNLVPLCQKDDTQLLLKPGTYRVIQNLVCETCGHRVPLDRDIENLVTSVEVQIQRKIRSGEWLDALNAERARLAERIRVAASADGEVASPPG